MAFAFQIITLCRSAIELFLLKLTWNHLKSTDSERDLSRAVEDWIDETGETPKK